MHRGFTGGFTGRFTCGFTGGFTAFVLLLKYTNNLVISNLANLISLMGLENLAYYGGELSITNNPKLVTLAHLSANLPPNYTLTVTNIGVGNNAALRDVAGLRTVNYIKGMCCTMATIYHSKYLPIKPISAC